MPTSVLLDRFSLFAGRLGLGVALAASIAGTPGCGKPKHATAPEANAESGPDASRTGAAPMATNTSVTDAVDYDRQDQTDWKALDLKGNAGVLTVELRWDSSTADLALDVFDSFGTLVGASPAAQVQQIKKLLIPVDNPGQYFVRVIAPGPKMASTYNLIAGWDGEPPAPVAVAEPAAPAPVEEPKKRRESSPGPRREKKAAPEGSVVQGRIVSSYRAPDGGLVLYLDKGSGAGVAEGNSGRILDGSGGESALEGGTFSVTKIVDANKSIAKTPLKSLGRNTRVNINTR